MGWTLAAVNYNGRRRPGAPFCERLDGKLGSVFTMLTEVLEHRGDWRRKPATRDRNGIALPSSFHLLLGTAQGKGIPWEYHRCGSTSGPPPLVNYYYGFEALTRKADLVATLELAEAACAGNWPRQMPAELTSPDCVPVGGGAVWEVMPKSLVFHPDAPGTHRAFRSAFFAAFAAAGRMRGPQHNLWIVKPSAGCKGRDIFVSHSYGQIMAFLTEEATYAALGEASAMAAWVVQRYVHNPLLLRGGRKFDLRCWVLVDAEYSVWLYRQGVVRTAAVPYDVADLGNYFAHLTNHCIAERHAAFGAYEPNNELFYNEFDAELSRRFPQRAAEGAGSVLHGVLLPQVRRLAVQSLLAARPQLESGYDDYDAFQLFGYDFVVDADLRVWLCEVNASPAVAEPLLPGLVRALVRRAVDPLCPPDASRVDARRLVAEAEAAARNGEGFERLLLGRSAGR